MDARGRRRPPIQQFDPQRISSVGILLAFFGLVLLVYGRLAGTLELDAAATSVRAKKSPPLIAPWPKISVCVPAIEENFGIDLPRLIASVDSQLRPPHEMVVVASGVDDDDSCRGLKTRLSSYSRPYALHIQCLQQPLNQAEARNFASSLASGEWVSFIDADDTMVRDRLAVLGSFINDRHGLKLILHGYSGAEEAESDRRPLRYPLSDDLLMFGNELYDLEEITRGEKLSLGRKIMHSQPTVRRDLLELVRFRTGPKFYRSEDAFFVRDAIQLIGCDDEAMLWANVALSRHIPRRWKTGG